MSGTRRYHCKFHSMEGLYIGTKPKIIPGLGDQAGQNSKCEIETNSPTSSLITGTVQGGHYQHTLKKIILATLVISTNVAGWLRAGLHYGGEVHRS